LAFGFDVSEIVGFLMTAITRDHVAITAIDGPLQTACSERK